MQDLSTAFQKQFASFLLPLPDATVYLIPAFIPAEDQLALQEALTQKVAWRQEKIRMFGKQIDQPRLTAWYADAGKAYTYSGLIWEPLPWLPELTILRTALQELTGASFNSVLLNLYRHGQDSMGWHADDERELGQNPIIASVSLGQERTFSFRHRQQKDLKHTLVLPSGSLLLMAGPTQHFWLHQLPKTTKAQQPRLNLTFRFIY
ncbi:alpha-ketoglutarate-dependent dioxygenase AlkB [Rufibacter glacialis]|uniref:Alpha-ketoglutarate-dependent dioxygenase AlkB n=1 Tax=Rufibacter glacialis TaxID=1259555 RepID=A0A5M8QFU8_9BACT|nr:alpha-ketoglutarate-dependent dioxygenase AlkB [Rufibacter glacialis]KAA6433292.1 alpha-ketoglutarate-dependent dioxygenase AlkB [Rufibacter glacialis]GGK75703.1 DNA methylase [Rufibacter glacialis]